MITLSATDQRNLALKATPVRPVMLSEIGLSPVIRVTTAGRDITVGSATYQTDSNIVSVQIGSLKNRADRDIFQMTLTGAPPGDTEAWREKLGGKTGTSINVLVAFVEEDGGITDTLDVYAGKLAGAVWEPQEDGPVLETRWTGPLAKLDGQAMILVTDADQRRRESTDTAQKYAHRVLELVWGRR